MTLPPPDQSRDRRIEDPTNLWLIHPAGRLLLPWFVARGIPANAVSLIGLTLGALAALAYVRWDAWPFAFAGLLLSVGWLIADGLDGMIARATGTASPLGRILDGLCDHGVFVLIYVMLATSIATLEGWALAVAAGAAHALQSNLYESERARFHRRCRGGVITDPVPSRNPLVRLYDHVAGALDRAAFPLDQALGSHRDPAAHDAYRAAATGPMRLMSLLTANVRVLAIFIACLVGDPRLFWWFELVPLTAVLVSGLLWHRQVETGLIQRLARSPISLTYSTDGAIRQSPIDHLKDMNK
ncbi:CDP-alcohol phosphatidyltransferase family protein [Sphingomonas sp. BT-65]|uniref:CDP-alcohol phosphatidyltransferase family protein n=1 Tax=Sphingomonas sp. BT-65 TaxID=2989821 RepID=UPI002235B9FF|nr:CDP-alcohol phosphatidyltransferase family protein [Sphingomonas sp. BT-65]MCW4460718.1 CDP-alcohol phosphatidyltransferase family protein [Sphingomonas sp. BT-65]